jgi:HlyD family secretion protein
MSKARAEARRLGLWGLAVGFGLVGGMVVWSATANVAGAVIASGVLVVESSVKRVQHPGGGVVGELMAKEGLAVKAGDILIRLDDTTARASLGVINSALHALQARESRLLAERDGSETIQFPPELTTRASSDPEIERALIGEAKLFDARRTSRDALKQQLRERIGQLNDESRGLASQQNAKEREIVLIRKELADLRDLLARNLIPVTRVNSLQRDEARLDGDLGNIIATLARTRGRVSETEIQILQVDQEQRTEVLRELREAQGKIAELQERRIAAENELRQIDIRAPQDGVVHQLTIHSVGSVIRPGETILSIVPRADNLVVDARIAPQDVDQVRVGSEGKVRIMAGNQRMMTDLDGEVIRVGADLTQEPQTGLSFYTVRLALREGEIKKLDGLVLQAGMPAETFIATQDRTALQYLLTPLTEQIARTFRER